MLELSALPKTWLIDVDGTIVKHNGYFLDGHDTLLEGAREFIASIPPEDRVIIMTAREEEYLPALKEFLDQNGIRYDQIVTDLTVGERIVINDRKPSGLDTAYAINKDRDKPLNVEYKINSKL